MTKFWSTTSSNYGTVTPYGLLRTPESQDQLPSPLGCEVILKINSCNSSYFMELPSSLIALLCNIGQKYVHA
jgi:hypothetical protein